MSDVRHANRGLPVRLFTVAALLASVHGLGGCRMFDGRWGSRTKAKVVAKAAGAVEVGEGARLPTLPTDQPVAGTDSLRRGTVLMEQGLNAEAAKQFELAIAENPLLTPAHMNLGDIRYKEGNLEAAEQAFGQAAGLEPRNFDAQFKHAMVLHELLRLDAAIRSYLRALALRPDDFRANSNIAAAYLQGNEPSEALPYAQRAIELNPNDGPSRTNLGAVYSSLGQHENAITEYQQAAELTELSPKLLLNLADSYGKVKRYDEMVSTLEQVIKLEPSATAHERLASGLFRLGKFDDALVNFDKAAEIDPNHYPAFNGIGVCLLRKWIASQQDDLDARDEALNALRRSLQIERNQPRVLELVSRYQ